MKYLAAFGLLSLSKSKEPTLEEVKTFLESIGEKVNTKKLAIVIEEIKLNGQFTLEENEYNYPHYMKVKDEKEEKGSETPYMNAELMKKFMISPDDESDGWELDEEDDFSIGSSEPILLSEDED